MKLLLIYVLCFSELASYAQVSEPTKVSEPLIDYCNQITKEYNEFDQTTTFRTPLLKSCFLDKVISKNKAVFYLSLYANGYTINLGEKGVKIILSNKQIISFPNEKIEVDISEGGNGYRYSAFITIPPDKMPLFKKYKITKWQLFIYAESQSDFDAEAFRNMVNCMAGLK